MEVYNEAESQYSPRLRIFSSCCNRHVRKSQLNGSHGEATNSDDVKRLDQAQNRRLERIEQKLSQMSLEKKKSTKKKNGKSKRPSSAPKTFRTFGASAAAPAIESFDAQKPIGTIQPDMVSAVAQVAPFRIPKGIASVLTNPRPSQKITARAIGSVTVANGSTLLGNFSPCVASDIWCHLGHGICHATSVHHFKRCRRDHLFYFSDSWNICRQRHRGSFNHQHPISSRHIVGQRLQLEACVLRHSCS